MLALDGTGASMAVPAIIADARAGCVRSPGLARLTRLEARSVEQVLIEFHGFTRNGGTLLNKINSIARTDDGYAKALRTGCRLLRKAGYPGFGGGG